MRLRKILCVLGFHKWGLRSIHLAEGWSENQIFKAGVIDRCEVCGADEITSRERDTRFVVSTKHLSKEGRV